MCEVNSPVYEALDHFFHTYLVERDLEKTLSLLTEDVYSLGTGAEEIASNREEFAALLRAEFSALPGPIYYRIQEYQEKEWAPGIWACLCRMTTTLAVEGGRVVEYDTRLTAHFREQDGRYLAAVLHMSEASANQAPNEFFPLRFANQLGLELEDVSKHGLIDLLDDLIPGGIIGAYMEEGFPFYAVNDTFLNMLGYTYEEFVMETGGMVYNAIHVEDRTILDGLFSGSAFSGDSYELEYRLKKKSGEYLWVYDMGKKISTPEGKSATICLIMDMTERIRKQERLLKEARLDSLTGIFNRRGGEEQIERALQEGGGPWAFLLLDIDFFKNVNDFYGHQEGDRLLNSLARKLKSSFRSTDILMRLGGDEFGVFLYACSDLKPIQRKLEELGQWYQAQVRARYPQSGSTLSFGGVYGQGSVSFPSLYKKADQLLYESKQRGKASYHICAQDEFDPCLYGRTIISAETGSGYFFNE